MPNGPIHPIYLSLQEFIDLEFHLMNTRPGVKTDAFVSELIKNWLAVDSERIDLRKNGPPMHGFQWKDLFLPEGTCLRTSFHHAVEFAKVVGDRVRSDDGISLTPSQFVNRHAEGRNAWRFVWLRFPGEANWVRAFDCRTRMRKQANAGLNDSKKSVTEQIHRSN